jgi:Transposase, Mutator family
MPIAMAVAFIGTIFAKDTKAAAKVQWCKVTEQMQPCLPKLAAFLDEAEEDVLAYMDFAPAHWVKLHSTNPIERRNGEIKLGVLFACRLTISPQCKNERQSDKDRRRGTNKLRCIHRWM